MKPSRTQIKTPRSEDIESVLHALAFFVGVSVVAVFWTFVAAYFRHLNTNRKKKLCL